MGFRYIVPPHGGAIQSVTNLPALPDTAALWERFEQSEAITGNDADWVTILNIPQPVVLTRNIFVIGQAPVGGALSCDFRVIVHGAVIETRSLIFSAVSAQKFYKMLFRGVDDSEGTLSQYSNAAGEYPYLTLSDLTVQRKVFNVSGVCSIGARTAGSRISGNTQNPTGVVRLDASRSTTVAEGAFVTIAQYIGRGVISAFATINEFINFGGGTSDMRVLIDDIPSTVQLGNGSGPPGQWFAFGPIVGMNYSAPLSNMGDMPLIHAWSNVRFERSFKMQSKCTFIGPGPTLSWIARALIITY